ncbi:hypothetical protein SCAB_48171 [Streptomyces scabiei 87.22]|uniref:HK97 gp10 family phage protein n=1 Tax=Streptomyces scabiei (strain 87.22) TaxID=680198 RepID=C9ZDU4_STRSW|nr:hypothetical protein [Streptomyces scabiei]MDX2892504.1 hypothetical protein [Streptomyces scabiei]MDX2900597.1 hypothetical protein [Streptomyces scabiei]MDX2994129.1 hypothetical protein [Streptomyces scabiei]MDX3084771.1 hypothetical protein [Streptomyces scabiei]MDX3137899.1 hypothetical protein [Streptomyces scabiei]
MVQNVRITGTGQLLELARKLRAAGHENIRASYIRRIRRAAEPLRSDLQDAVRRQPLQSGGRGAGKRGGPSPTTRPFRESIAQAIRLSVRTAGNPGARVWLDKGLLPPDIPVGAVNQMNDLGRLRHPVFGNKKRWSTQTAERGFWEKTIRAHQGRITREVERVTDDVRRRLE